MEKHDGRAAGAVRFDDPWYDALASGWGEQGSTPQDGVEAPGHGAPAPPSAAADLPGQRTTTVPPPPPHAGVYLTVQRSAAFQEVRRRYRSFAVPATVLFLAWYFAYVLASVAAPGLMGRQVIGPLNVALLAGLGQFATTFLLTWAHARHARLRRDRAALELRWETQEMTGGNLR